MPPRTSIANLKTDRARLSRALDDLRAGKVGHLRAIEKAQLAKHIKQRLERVDIEIRELEDAQEPRGSRTVPGRAKAS